MALVFLFEFVDLVIDFVERAHLVEGESDDAALLGDGLQDALTNPPHGIRDELESARLIEFLGSLDQADVTFVDEVGKCESLMLILLGYRYDKSQVGGDELILGSFAIGTALLYFLCQFNFFINGNQWCTTNFNEVFVQSFA